jgi:hypothetical protein
MSQPNYVRLSEGDTFPDLQHIRPLKAIVVVEENVSPEWRTSASEWLVEQGCLYMMAWGIDCSGWDDSVDWANIERFDYGDIPNEQFVLTTWHEREPLIEVFWFCRYAAMHDVSLENAVIIHISRVNKAAEMVSLYANSAKTD